MMKNGDSLICNMKGKWVIYVVGWFGIIMRKKVNGPKLNEIVTFERDSKPGFIFLKEYKNYGGYEERFFSPLVSDAVLENELNEISIKKLND